MPFPAGPGTLLRAATAVTGLSRLVSPPRPLPAPPLPPLAPLPSAEADFEGVSEFPHNHHAPIPASATMATMAAGRIQRRAGRDAGAAGGKSFMACSRF